MQESVPLLLKLLVAHVLGDFLLQTDAMVRSKQSARGLLPHGAVHAACLLAVACTEAVSMALALACTAILITHLLIDRWTAGWKPMAGWRLLADQALHLLALLIAVALVRPGDLRWIAATIPAWLQDARPWWLLLGAGISTGVGAVVIRLVVSPYTRRLVAERSETRPGLEAAGRLIGILERAIVFFAITMRMEALVGFVIAAKAILRLPEAREPEHHALAEYYLIGSLASLLWAILWASLTRSVLAGGNALTP